MMGIAVLALGWLQQRSGVSALRWLPNGRVHFVFYKIERSIKLLRARRRQTTLMCFREDRLTNDDRKRMTSTEYLLQHNAVIK